MKSANSILSGNLVTYNSALSAFEKAGQWQQALQWLQLSLEQVLQLDVT